MFSAPVARATQRLGSPKLTAGIQRSSDRWDSLVFVRRVKEKTLITYSGLIV